MLFCNEKSAIFGSSSNDSKDEESSVVGVDIKFSSLLVLNFSKFKSNMELGTIFSAKEGTAMSGFISTSVLLSMDVLASVMFSFNIIGFAKPFTSFGFFDVVKLNTLSDLVRISFVLLYFLSKSIIVVVLCNLCLGNIIEY